jgi:RNA polymerase subunit RPABC4/transcription elongation factor Spt4
LKFTHRAHLDPAGVRGPDGRRVLDCGDCHVAEPGGAGFRRIAMERDCSSCHRLDFDDAFPDRVVPHGAADSVEAFLVDHYSRRYLEAFADPLANDGVRRRPGAAPDSVERARLLKSARAEAESVARDLFERRSCADCHEVTRTDRGWTVAEVRLTDRWLPRARFGHAAHSTSLTACSTCHAVTASEVATDVLLPELGTCRTCHAGDEQVADTCVTCHGFHSGDDPWSGLAAAR